MRRRKPGQFIFGPLVEGLLNAFVVLVCIPGSWVAAWLQRRKARNQPRN